MLYIHIPYCKGKCIYCDFYSAGNPDWKKYLKALANELALRSSEIGKSLSSVYIGGGTPSLVQEDEFESFIFDLNQFLENRNIAFDKNLEFTIEVNPEDVDEGKASVWKEAGVNRISMGVQSMNDEELKFLKRRHDSQKVKSAIDILKGYFENISVDLIYGLPNQDTKALKRSLEELIKLNPKHISAYALTYESNTPLSLWREQNKIQDLSENQYIVLSDLTVDMLEAHGFKRYEVSNFAMPGFESRHNKGYWEGRKYLGLGPAACSFDGNNVRRSNPRDLKKYLSFFIPEVSNDNSVFYEEEVLTTEELSEEQIMVSLRTLKGLDLHDFEERFGPQSLKNLWQNSQKWIKEGKLEMSDGYLKFTRSGFHISDFIIVDLVS